MAQRSQRNNRSVAAMLSLVGLLMFLGLYVVSSATSATAFSGDEPTAFSKCWDYPALPDLTIPVAGSNSAVYFVDNDRRLHAVDITGAARLWSSDLGGQVVSDLLATESSLFVVTNSGDATPSSPLTSKLRSISVHTGITNWTAELPATPSAWLGAVNGTIVAVGKQGEILGYSRESGLSVWSKTLAVAIAIEPHFESRSVLLGTVSNELVRVNFDGVVVPIAKLDHTPTAVFSDSGNRVMSGDERGNLLFMSSEGKRFWKFRNGAQISHILPYDSEFIVASHDNFMYKLSKNGNVEWKRRLSGRLFGEVLILTGIAVASVAGDGGVYIVNLTNGKILNRIEAGEGNSIRVAAVQGGTGFVTAGAAGLTYYSQNKCLTK